MSLLSLPLALAIQAGALGGLGAQAERGDPLVEPWRWRSYPELSGQRIRVVAETAQGTVFFGTRGGVWQYDGVDWREYGLTELGGSPVIALSVLPNGSVLAGTDRGVLRLDQSTWTPLYPLGEDARFPVRGAGLRL